MTRTRAAVLWSLCVVALLSLAPNAGAAGEKFSGLKPAAPKQKVLKPGLAVNYYFEFFRHIDELVEWMEVLKGKPGKPIPALDYQVGQGKVLTSDRLDGVGALIRGYLRFEQPGAYDIRVHSNDGVRLKLGGKQVFEDPGVHADRMSEPLTLEIKQAGWYPIELLYYERKNTATLQLLWKPPGAADFTVVPRAAYAHSKK